MDVSELVYQRRLKSLEMHVSELVPRVKGKLKNYKCYTTEGSTDWLYVAINNMRLYGLWTCKRGFAHAVNGKFQGFYAYMPYVLLSQWDKICPDNLYAPFSFVFSFNFKIQNVKTSYWLFIIHHVGFAANFSSNGIKLHIRTLSYHLMILKVGLKWACHCAVVY